MSSPDRRDGGGADVDAAARVVGPHDALDHERGALLLAQPGDVGPAGRRGLHPLAVDAEERRSGLADSPGGMAGPTETPWSDQGWRLAAAVGVPGRDEGCLSPCSGCCAPTRRHPSCCSSTRNGTRRAARHRDNSRDEHGYALPASFGRLAGNEFIGVIRAPAVRLAAGAVAGLARPGPRRAAARPACSRSTCGR